MLRVLGKQYICGGTLVNKLYILTAAHCICQNSQNVKCIEEEGQSLPDFPIQIFEIYLGTLSTESQNSLDSDMHRVAEIKIHPKFDIKTAKGPFDLALLRFTKVAQLDFYIS